MMPASGDLVGRAPWPAADPLVGPLECSKSRTGGSDADGGVRPKFWLPLSCIVGQVGNLRRVANPPAEACNTDRRAPVANPVANRRAGQLPPIITIFCETQI